MNHKLLKIFQKNGLKIYEFRTHQLCHGLISFVFELNRKVTRLTKDKSIGRHPYWCLENRLVCPKCIINFHCPIFSRRTHCFLKNLLHFSIRDFILPICLRVICQSNSMLDSILQQKCLKLFVTKVSALITYDGSRGPKYYEDVLL